MNHINRIKLLHMNELLSITKSERRNESLPKTKLLKQNESVNMNKSSYGNESSIETKSPI